MASHSIDRRGARALRAPLTILPLLVAAACGGAGDERVADHADDIVDPGSPAYGPSSAGDLGPLPVHGWFPQRDGTGVDLGYNAQYSNGQDLVAAPTGDVFVADLASVGAAWRTKLAGDAYQSTPALRQDVDDALAKMRTDVDLSVLDAGGVTALFDFITALGGPPAVAQKHNSFLGYAPIRARWRSRELKSGGSGRFAFSYWKKDPAPHELDELRDRGARVYCAARRARDQQGDNVASMGEQVGFKTSILGREIDFLVVEPTVVLDAASAYTSRPGRFSQRSDGGQAFEVPMKFGTRITPIRGVGLPGLPEMRYPVALTMADGEVTTRADRKPTNTGNTFTKEYTTAAHGDAIATAFEQITAGEGARVILFTTGWLTVDLGLQLDFDLGRPVTNDAELAKARWDERLLKTDGLDLGFPGTPGFTGTAAFPIRTRSGSAQWYGPRRIHDGAWLLKPACGTEFHPCPPWDWSVLEPDGAMNSDFQTKAAAIGPMETRVWQDDDHEVQTRTAMTLTGSVGGHLGIRNIGPFSIALDVVGKLSGTVGQTHVVRDAAWAEGPWGGPMRAVSGVTVRPRTDASVNLLDTTADLHLSIYLGWFGTVTWDAHLFTIPGTNLASYDSDSDHAFKEDATLRIGAGSSVGADKRRAPDVSLHLPGPTEVASFTGGNDVDSCLAEPPDTRRTPDTCKAKPTDGAPVRANLCAYTFAQLPPGLCADIPRAVAALGASGDMATCWSQYLSFLCEPTSYFAGGILSHIVDDGDMAHLTANLTKLAEVERTCVNAAVPNTGDKAVDHAAAKVFMDSFFKLAVCDASGQPIGDAGLITSVGDPSKTPTPTAAGTCK